MRVIDNQKTINQLAKGEATPEQQVEIACLLILLKELGNWGKAEDVQLSMLATGLIARKQ